MPDAAGPAASRKLRVEYRRLEAGERLGPEVLAAVAFGGPSAVPRDPRCVLVPLEPRVGAGLVQVWTGTAPVALGQTGAIRHSADGNHLMGWLEAEERDHASLADAAEAIYRELLEFHAGSTYRHLWRIWNFIDDINAGEGDDERYRQFCLGRARAFEASAGLFRQAPYPAATTVGSLDGSRRLRICWLAGVEPGEPVENPRQVSAYRYPRQYGPAPPSFSRATLAPGDMLLVSGTASIVGHGSLHPGDVCAQLEETLRNLDAVAATAATLRAPRASTAPLLTAFLRRPLDAGEVERELRRHFPDAAGLVILDADICRAELQVEIEVIS